MFALYDKNGSEAMNSDNDEEAFDLGGLSNPEEASDSEEADEGVDADLFLQEKYPSDELSADALAELEQLVGNSPQDTQAAWKYCTEDGNEGPFLRDYQIESVQRTLLHWRDSETPAAISLPTATGKSWVSQLSTCELHHMSGPNVQRINMDSGGCCTGCHCSSCGTGC